MPTPILNNLIIELHVPDLNAAKDFYSRLGFEVRMDDAPNAEKPGYLTMIRKDIIGNTMLNFYGGDERVYDQSFFKQFPKDTKKGYAVSITIPVGDIDVVYKTSQESLSENIVRELRVIEGSGKRWKDFRMVDPFGFYLRFTELLDWGQE
jgi:predicted enzyme related to lactoylglutathione lyase